MFSRLIFRRVHRCSDLQSPKSPSEKSAGLGVEKVQDLLNNAATFTDARPHSEQDSWATLPYVEGTFYGRNQALKSSKPKIDPRETSIILFPGQGAQYVGMASRLLKYPGARDIFALANQVLGYDLLKICVEGPKSKLDQTVYCQPAVMVSSLAALEQLKEERPNAIDNCYATAGFSLGEITALVFAGALPFDRALKLVQIRAEAMQVACQHHKSGMATLMYGPDARIGEACKDAIDWCIQRGTESPECKISNYLYPSCKVIGGSEEALKFLDVNMKKYGIKRIKRLPVIGAFHTELMESAVEPFAKALKKIKIEDPIISVHSNVDGKRYRNASHVLNQLPKQIVRPVKWEQTLHNLYERRNGEHFPRTFECGPGHGLKAVLKMVNAKAWDSTFSIEA
ncbi:probable malonyl-CoA-acyl carrier protein transacylase, mitochondrial [Toxorhynchites rutilus septentrionalis]|uniref:probable malonyl-CoA-acyl carrier protein transacylase, mitochondrial n=1 Tax=Toxorhynchites rutilus septentrionalis TaxID=329112 RepID=UPI00247A7943|nr:probable malonyl-CoA-acyl carrier protein transacylase, mitochondrial [Toxorhynchites rutilus septentrionalis]